MHKTIKFLASPMLMAILFIFIAVSSAVATFIENDFGSQAARALVYNTWWFELIFITLSINLILSVYINKLFRKEKFPVFLFHIAFVIIVVGAGVTRYFGIEGMLHIRENKTENSFASSDTWLEVYVNNNIKQVHKANFSNVTSNRLKSSINIDGKEVNYSLNSFIPHAVETVVEHHEGNPVVSLILIDSVENETILIQPQKPYSKGYNSIGFEGYGRFAINIALSDSGILAQSTNPIQVKSMIDGNIVEIQANTWVLLQPQKIFSTNGLGFAYRGYLPKAKIVMAYSSNPSVPGIDALALSVKVNSNVTEIFVPRTEIGEKPVELLIDGINLGFRFGSRSIELPFSITLNDFILERYPGSNSPSSFTSNVLVMDKERGIEKPFSIYMNNILNYRGFRFYQSSYDTDESGTYLSVNKDFIGTSITYSGYFLMILGMIWALFSPGSRFRKLLSKSAPALIFLLLSFSGFSSLAQQHNPKYIVPDSRFASDFGHILVQDKGGRVKPLSTLAGETLRKLNRSNSFKDYSAEQVFLAMTSFPEEWQHVQIIRISNEELGKLLGINGRYAAFTNFFNYETGGTYKLSQLVQQAFAAKPAMRTALQKEIVKVDERVNILYMIFSGQMARLIPDPNHPENKWLSMAEASENMDSSEVSHGAKIFSDLIAAVRKSAMYGGDAPKELLNDFMSFQTSFGGNIIPSKQKIKVEVFSNKLLAFERLIPFYGIIGFILLILVFIYLLTKGLWTNIPYISLSVILLIGFIVHTIAIALRWYIAGRAPLSNGYESMVYVAWAAMLAGFLFANRNRVVLPATALLSTLTLFVAHLSWMDPEITNLVPVLKSYWLTIHVAVITASYGFLGLGAILGLFNLVLFALKNRKNKEVVNQQIVEITVINELALTIGLYLLTIGSFLGAVWANESWGRYWGWDPKETWALITIIVYTFILHMRQVPSFRTNFSFNFGSLIGIGSVLMTYFGVNYYLSGLHSYAGGDPIPVPSWIYFAVAAILSFSFFAWYNSRLVDSEEDNKNK